ncbi:MAG: NF038104 family lipoprotein [Phenylobacterium sp.]|uniref:NF038104 family lipoprotein n=1 Tax=Phenylobacterium sp. TaxID=1871053 RepID=UPI003919FCEF
MNAVRIVARMGLAAALAASLSGCLAMAVGGAAVGVAGAAVGVTAKGVGMAAGAVIPDGDDEDDRKRKR